MPPDIQEVKERGSVSARSLYGLSGNNSGLFNRGNSGLPCSTNSSVCGDALKALFLVIEIYRMIQENV